MKIHLLGASGSGTTSLGRALAARFSVPHFESDDLFWEQTPVPYSQVRPVEKRRELLDELLQKHDSLVFSGSAMGWGDRLLSACTRIILVRCPVELRLERLKRRESERFGERILPQGDMFKNHEAFMEWAAGYDTGGLDMRSLKSEQAWTARASCPVFVVENRDFEETLEELVALV